MQEQDLDNKMQSKKFIFPTIHEEDKAQDGSMNSNALPPSNPQNDGAQAPNNSPQEVGNPEDTENAHSKQKDDKSKSEDEEDEN